MLLGVQYKWLFLFDKKGLVCKPCKFREFLMNSG